MSYVCVYRTVWLRVCVCVYCTDQDVTCIYYVEPIVMYLHYAMIKSSFGGYPRTEATTTSSRTPAHGRKMQVAPCCSTALRQTAGE